MPTANKSHRRISSYRTGKDEDYAYVLAALLPIWLFTASPVCNADEPALKPDVPRMDGAGPGAGSGPLKGKIQIKEHLPGFSGQQGRIDRRGLRGRAEDRTLSGQVESMIGIIGVKFIMFAGAAPVISQIFPYTPAAGSDLRLRDVIVAVDGIPTLGLTKDEVYDMIVGTPGTPVTLSVRGAGDEFRAVTLTRMDLNELKDPLVRRDYMLHM